MSSKLRVMLAEWNDPYAAKDVPDAEDLITELQIELSGKEEVINTLSKDLKYFKELHAERQKRGF